MVLFLLLDVDGGDGAPPRRARGPGARQLDAVLHPEPIEIRGRLAEQVAPARVRPDHVGELVGEPEVDRAVGVVDPVGLRLAQQELVAEVATLVEHAELGAEILVAKADRNPHHVVGVDEIERGRVDVEEREDTGLQTDLPPHAPDPIAVEGEAFAEAHRREIAEVLVADVVLPRRSEARPARVGDQRRKEQAARKYSGLPLGENTQGLRESCRRRDRLRERWHGAGLEHDHAGDAADLLELGDHASPIDRRDIRGREADDPVLDAQRRDGQGELALENGGGVTGDERVVARYRRGVRDRQQEDQHRHERRCEDHRDASARKGTRAGSALFRFDSRLARLL